MTLHLAVSQIGSWLSLSPKINSKCVPQPFVFWSLFHLKADPHNLASVQPLPWITSVMAHHLRTSVFYSVSLG